MLAELHKTPSCYAVTKDNIATMIRMTGDAQRLAVFASNPEGKNFAAELPEAALQPLRDGVKKDLPWEKFFDELQGAFNNGRVSANGGGAALEVQFADGAKVTLKLEPTAEDVQQVIFTSLMNYHHVHVHLKEVEKQLDEAAAQEEQMRTQALELEREEAQLKEGILRNKEQDEVNQKRLADLQAELALAEEEKRKSGDGADIDEEDEELLICRARNPLGRKDHKDYDPELLRLVKGRYVTAEQEAKYPVVIRPYTTSELEQHTRSFTTKQREVIWECLKKIDEWDYDVFTIQQQMSGDDHASLAFQEHGGSLFITCFTLMYRYKCVQRFNIDEQLLLNWLSVIEAGYHANPYHNSMHAADVLHITHYILSCGGLIRKCHLTDEDVFAALMAATIHDYDHPGINNSFHVKAQTYLATLYNDRSILENRHVSSVFELMKLPKFNILSSFTEEQKRDIRDTVIEMVLATDMGLHAKFVNQFKRRLQENHDFTKKDDIRLALAMAVKMADISNCGRPEHLYLRWSSKISDEFYMQGDRERNLGMPCSPFMDRTQPAMAKGQIAFMNYIVVPLFECISELVEDMHFSVDHTENNKAYWTRNDDTPQ